MASKKLTPGQRVLKLLAKDIQSKLVRLRNKAALVELDPSPGRNLTSLRNTAAEMIDLLHKVAARRCRVCGCTQHDCEQCIEKTGDACTWVSLDLCSACVEDGQ